MSGPWIINSEGFDLIADGFQHRAGCIGGNCSCWLRPPWEHYHPSREAVEVPDTFANGEAKPYAWLYAEALLKIVSRPWDQGALCPICPCNMVVGDQHARGCTWFIAAQALGVA